MPRPPPTVTGWREALTRGPHPGRRDRAEPLARPTRLARGELSDVAHPIPRLRAGRSLGVVLMAIALGGCAGAATTAPSPTPVPSPTPAASTSAPTRRADGHADADAADRLRPPAVRRARQAVRLRHDGAARLQGHVRGAAGRRDRPDITYPSGGYDVFGKLVIPDGEGPFPAVLYAAGYDVWSQLLRSRDGGLREGGLRRAGDREPSGRPTSTAPSTRPPTIEGYAHYVVDLRRGVDLLGTLPTDRREADRVRRPQPRLRGRQHPLRARDPDRRLRAHGLRRLHHAIRRGPSVRPTRASPPPTRTGPSTRNASPSSTP